MDFGQLWTLDNWMSDSWTSDSYGRRTVRCRIAGLRTAIRTSDSRMSDVECRIAGQLLASGRTVKLLAIGLGTDVRLST